MTYPNHTGYVSGGEHLAAIKLEHRLSACEKENQELRRLLGMVSAPEKMTTHKPFDRYKPSGGWTAFWAECEKVLSK